MAGSGDDEGDAVLSDVEGDDQVPILIKSSSADEISPERFREMVSELDREKQARFAAEKSRADLEVSFNRLKALTHEAIRKRDEVGRQRDDAIREKEEALGNFEKVKAELAEVNRAKEEITRQFDEAAKERDALRSEIGNSMHMLVTGTEKISGKVSAFKNFGNAGLPRSQKYSGMAAVAYGVIKRTNEIVEELLKQIESASKSRNEAREQIDQRNYEIAIEVSQLEAAISGLRAEVSEKASVIVELEKKASENEGKLSEVERETEEKLAELETEAMELRKLVSEYDEKIAKLESKAELLRPLLFDQLNLVSKIHDRVCDLIKIVDASSADQSEFSESLFVPQETDVEENVRASLAGMESIFEITRVVAQKTRDGIEEKDREIRSLEETISRLNVEKEHIGSLLRSALSKQVTSNRSSKTSDLFQVAENGLKEAGIDFKFGKLTGDINSSDKVSTMESENEEIYALAGALEDIIKTSQLEIIELQHSVAELRAESCLLKAHVETQTKELDQCLRQIEQLKEKEKVANDSVEGLMMDIAAAEEEITRWKLAAEQEAAAGRAVEQEFLAQLSGLKQEVEEAKEAMVESDKRLKFKEETAAAAMGARDAAEKSLRMADSRASRLRERVEELTRQLEELESREDSRRGGGGSGGPRYMCWPWHWLGMDFVGGNLRPDTQEQRGSNEMELSEPFL